MSPPDPSPPPTPRRGLLDDARALTGPLFALALLAFLMSRHLPDEVRRVLHREVWRPSGVQCQYPISPVLLLPLLAGLGYLWFTMLVHLVKAIRGRGIAAEARIWAPRLVVTLIATVLPFEEISTTHAAQALMDERISGVLARLHVGQSRSEVDALVVEANLALLRPDDAVLIGRDEDEDQVVAYFEHRLGRLNKGEQDALLDSDRPRSKHDRCLLTPLSDAKDGTRYYTRRYYYTDAPTDYRLTVEVDPAGLLARASYIKTINGEGKNQPCTALIDVPPLPGVTYPTRCP